MATLRTIGTGVSQVEAMYADMRQLEVQKDEEIAALAARLSDLEALLAERTAREAFLIAAVEKLERKVSRRDQTVDDLTSQVREWSRREAAANEALAKAKGELDEALHQAAAVRRERDEARHEALSAEVAYNEAVASLSALERTAVRARAAVLAADLDSEADVRRTITACASTHAEIAFARMFVGVADCRRGLAGQLATSERPEIRVCCKAMLSSLRRLGDDIAAGCRVAFMSVALAAPLAAGVRKALKSSTCGGDCCLLAHRCVALCEASLIQPGTLTATASQSFEDSTSL
jgi:hypothetical protein